MATPETKPSLKAVAPASKQIEVPIKKATGPGDDKIHTWPHLVRNEFLISIGIILLLIVWSLLVDAPLEEPANPTRTPNPSKAPWYFLGLQEMLVFFDPWHAGVVLPTFIILVLMVIPFLDINPTGNGYYCWKDRKWEVLTCILILLVMVFVAAMPTPHLLHLMHMILLNPPYFSIIPRPSSAWVFLLLTQLLKPIEFAHAGRGLSLGIAQDVMWKPLYLVLT